MKLSKNYEKLEKSAVKLTVTVDKADIEETYKKVTANYTKNAQIPGFRKGHVPAKVLETKYGEALKADTLSEVIDASLNEIFSDEKETENRPLPYAQPAMEKMPEFELGKDLVYSVTYDVFPSVNVKNFSGITVKEPQVTVGDAELAEELKGIQERNATVTDKTSSEGVAKNDIVTINYSELDDSGNVIEGSKREGFVFTVGSGENIYKIDDEILGMKKDETKEITKTYKKDDADKELAGKTKKISVTVKAIKVRDLPTLDDELAQDVNSKYKTLDDLKADLKRQMETALKRRLAEIKNNDLLSQLVEKNQFELPESMLQAELDGRWRMMAQQFQTTTDQLERMMASSGQAKEAMLDAWKPEAEKMLKSRIIIENLLKERNISVTPEEIEAQYAKIAEEGGMTVEEVKKHYEDPRSKEYLIDDAKEAKLYEELYKEVKVSKGDKMTFAELFRQR
ncbi:MAG: trigger factor [Treponema sp.]|nr:trigger factor [Treponema sp.]